MSGLGNIFAKSLANEFSCLYLPLRTGSSSFESDRDIFKTANKAAILGFDSTQVDSTCSQNKGVAASLYILGKFFIQMRTGKNLTATAQGASVSTSAHETSLSIYCRDNLLKSIESLFDNYDIGRIASILNDLLYFASTPQDAKELDLDSIKSMTFDCTGLIHALSSAYVWYKDMEVENSKSL